MDLRIGKIKTAQLILGEWAITDSSLALTRKSVPRLINPSKPGHRVRRKV